MEQVQQWFQLWPPKSPSTARDLVKVNFQRQSRSSNSRRYSPSLDMIGTRRPVNAYPSTINIGAEDGHPRMTAEELENKFFGVAYSVWQYWGERTRVKDAHVHRYVHAFGRHDFTEL
ncbi:hypothetical protein QFC20_002271 [Naganishia adeliensis]|uniref:Uncharacterized protein n=1 Tax=Naganishia adeliensis TaxID=92952 RepID=A0ACC2WNT4_9TREE|nr:hypothetical protein QFC20_002271 [Naganishia adeliensis]